MHKVPSPPTGDVSTTRSHSCPLKGLRVIVPGWSRSNTRSHARSLRGTRTVTPSWYMGTARPHSCSLRRMRAVMPCGLERKREVALKYVCCVDCVSAEPITHQRSISAATGAAQAGLNRSCANCGGWRTEPSATHVVLMPCRTVLTTCTRRLLCHLLDVCKACGCRELEGLGTAALRTQTHQGEQDRQPPQQFAAPTCGCSAACTSSDRPTHMRNSNGQDGTPPR